MIDSRISIIICTYNRATLLDRCLRSLHQQTLSQEYWEVVVVDNNSTDHTKEITEKWRDQLPIFYVEELEQGLSYARNTGAKRANHEYLLYLDDDIFADPGLLEAYFQFLATTDMADVACLGGKVLVEWEGGNKPDWFPQEFENLYGLYDRGVDICDSTNAIGCNMLWRREILFGLGMFDVRLGRKGKEKIAGEETALVQKALKSGYKIKYIPAAVVRHWTPNSRQTKEYLFSICYWLGVSRSIANSANMADCFSRDTIKSNLKLIRNLFICVFEYLLSLIRSLFDDNKTTDTVYFWGKILFFSGNIIQNFSACIRKSS